MFFKKIALKKNQLAMFHTHELTDKEIDYIITKINAVDFLKRRIKFIKNCYSDNDFVTYEWLKKECMILNSLISKLDIFDK